MQNKKVGKYTFGFTEPVKGKGKGKAIGSVKVCPMFHLTLIWSYYLTLCRRFVLPRAETSLWQLINRRCLYVEPSIGYTTQDLRRWTMPSRGYQQTRTAGKKGNERTITGIATDALNRTVIVSTLDGTINVRIFCLDKCRANAIVILVL